MVPRGKLIAVEGIDGSGKRTQIEMLSAALTRRRIPHTSISFPRYDTFFGLLAGQFLDGKFGAKIDPHLSALLYAGDRFEARGEIESALVKGQIVLADRYAASNLAHQTARVPPAQRDDFIRWLTKLEFQIYGIPPEDLVIFLRVPVRHAQHLVGQKKARHYTSRRHDILEADRSHLRTASAIYEKLAKDPRWVTIDCLDKKTSLLESPEALHLRVMAAVDSRILNPRNRPV
jgi:dTMP kinase